MGQNVDCSYRNGCTTTSSKLNKSLYQHSCAIVKVHGINPENSKYKKAWDKAASSHQNCSILMGNTL